MSNTNTINTQSLLSKIPTTWQTLASKLNYGQHKPQQNFVYVYDDIIGYQVAEALSLQHNYHEHCTLIIASNTTQAINYMHVMRLFLPETATIQLMLPHLSGDTVKQPRIIITPYYYLQNLIRKIETAQLSPPDRISLPYMTEWVQSEESFEALNFIRSFKNPQLLIRFKNKSRLYLQKIAEQIGGFELIHTEHEKHSNTPLKTPVSPTNISIDSDTSQQNILEYFSENITDAPSLILLSKGQKQQAIQQLLALYPWQRVVVVTRTKQAAQRIEESFYRQRIKYKIIHSGLPEAVQQVQMNKLTNKEIRLLFVTDSLACQLDYPKLDAVIFYDLPDLEQEMLERISFFNHQRVTHAHLTLVSENELSWLEQIGSPTQGTYKKINYLSKVSINTNPHSNKNKTRPLTHNDKQKKNQQPSEHRKNHRFNKSTPTQDSNPNKLQGNGKPHYNNPNKKKMSQNKRPPNEQQGIVNQNRLPFEVDSFEANIARENKRRVRKILKGKPVNDPQVSEYGFNNLTTRQKNSETVKVTHRKRRKIDPENIGNH